jgi:hypothetical protein
MVKRLLLVLSFAAGVALAVVVGIERGRTSTGAPGNAAAEVEALKREVDPSIGHDCQPSERHHADADPEHPAFALIARGLALLVCRPVGAGVDTLYVWRFRDLDELYARQLQWDHYLGPATGVCDESDVGFTQWADSAGKTRGDLRCVRHDTGSFVIWSDTERLVLYEAFSESGQRDLNYWWRTRVRHLERARTVAEKKLLSLAGKVIETASCSREKLFSSPQAIASLRCQAPVRHSERPVGADRLRLELFAKSGQLDQHFSDYLATWGRLATRQSPSSNCMGGNPLDVDNWYRGDTLAGVLACFPALGAYHIAWTHDDSRLFAVLTREDQATGPARGAWRALADIGQ